MSRTKASKESLTGRQFRAELIREGRKARKVGVRWIAEDVGVTPQTWWRMERGQPTSLSLIRRASELLGLDWRVVCSPPAGDEWAMSNYPDYRRREHKNDD